MHDREIDKMFVDDYKIWQSIKIACVTRYKDMPPGWGDVAEADRERIMHVLLPISKEVSLMGADSPSAMKTVRGNNVWLALNVESTDEARHVFERLSDGGKITMPLKKTFYVEFYGMLTDQFGICWMVMFPSAE